MNAQQEGCSNGFGSPIGQAAWSQTREPSVLSKGANKCAVRTQLDDFSGWCQVTRHTDPNILCPTLSASLYYIAVLSTAEICTASADFPYSGNRPSHFKIQSAGSMKQIRSVTPSSLSETA